MSKPMTNYNEKLDDELRMDAYYYSFSPTGNINIDRILSAVATAGEHYHHTQEWQEGGEQEAIQKAANDAAQAITSLIKELVAEAKIDELKHLIDDDGIWYQDMARQFPQKITLNQRIKELEAWTN